MRTAGRAIAAGVLLFLFPSPAAGRDAGPTASCVACHAELGGELAVPVAEWRGSVHAKNGITCAGCHGGDPAVTDMEAMGPDKDFRGAPGPKEIPGFCGRCHYRVKEDYLESAHGKALGGGGPQCVTCHGTHAVGKATIDIISPERCTTCHGYGRAGEIKEALIRTDRHILGLHEEIRSLHRIGYDTEDIAQGLFRVRNEFHGLFHTVDVERVRRHTDDFENRLSGLGDRLATLERVQSRRRLLGAVIVGILALLTLVLALLYRSYRREEKQEG